MGKGKKRTKFVPIDQIGKIDNKKEEKKEKKVETTQSDITIENKTEIKNVESKKNEKNEKKKVVKDEKEDFSMCIICTENVLLYAVGVCNHPICHKCSLRLRLLYGTKECPYCKVESIKIFNYRL